jgi:hypothetical protein
MRRLLPAAFLMFIGTDVLAQGSPVPVDEQRSQYAAFVENSVCGSMVDFVGFYVSFRLSGEQEGQSKQRYREIRDAWNPGRMAVAELKMSEKQAALYSDLAHRGGALADKYVELLRPQIEKSAADLKAKFPNERLKPELAGGQILEVTGAVKSEQERMQEQQEKAARIMCTHLTRSSIHEEFGEPEASRRRTPAEQ